MRVPQLNLRPFVVRVTNVRFTKMSNRVINGNRGELNKVKVMPNYVFDNTVTRNGNMMNHLTLPFTRNQSRNEPGVIRLRIL